MIRLAALLIFSFVCILSIAQEGKALSEAERILQLSREGKNADALVAFSKISAGDERNELAFHLAESLFDQGQGDSVVNLLDDFVSATKGNGKFDYLRLRACAMREHLTRSQGEDEAEETLKQAKTAFSRLSGSSERILEQASFYCRCAGDWKRRGTSQWDELTAITLRTLDECMDNGSMSLAMRIALMKSRLLSLRGENAKAVEALSVCLKHYFPESLKPCDMSKRQPDWARRILLALAEQYFIQAERAIDVSQKIERYSQAAGCLLKVIAGLPQGHPEFAGLGEQLLYCREVLSLLGRKLQLPASVATPETKDSVLLVKQLLDRKRFGTALTLAEAGIKDATREKLKPLMLALKAKALVGLERRAEAVEFCKEALSGGGRDVNVAETVLDLARSLADAGATDEAISLYSLFSEAAKNHPDLAQALFQCASLEMGKARFKDAAKDFLSCAECESRKDWKFKALLNAAQCQYEAGDYSDAVRTALSADALDAPLALKDELSLALAKSAFQLAVKDPVTNKEKGKLALARFSKLASSPTLPSDAKKSSTLLAGLSGLAIGDDLAATEYMGRYLQNWPHEPNELDILQSLFDVRMKKGDLSEAADLVEQAVKAAPGDPRSWRMLSSVAPKTLEKGGPSQALPVYRLALGLKAIEPAALLSLAEILLSPRFEPARAEADKLLSELFAAFLPQKANSKESGELYYRATTLKIRLGERKQAIALLDAMLLERKVYRYCEVKFLHAEQLSLEDNLEGARKDWLDVIVQSAGSSENSKKAAFLIADSHRKDDWKKAISMAWTIVPKSGKLESGEEGREWIRKALELISALAKQNNAPSDLAQASKLYLKLFPDDRSK